MEARELLAALLESLEKPEVKEYYTTEEAGKMLNRKPSTLRTWCQQNRIDYKKSGDPKRGRLLIPHAEVERLKANHCQLRPVATSAA